MRKILVFTILTHLIISLWACRLLEEMLHTEVPEVAGCTLETDHFQLSFSTEMNQNLTEQAFKLTEKDNSLEGDFLWKGSALSFYPYTGILENKTYTLTLEESAEDKYGNSISKSERWIFHPGEDSIPPLIQSVIPMDQSEISNLRQSFTFSFSEAIDEFSFYDSLDIEPAFKFSLEWSDDSKIVTIHPLEDLSEDREYCMTVSTDLKDKADNNLKQEFIVNYKTPQRGTLFLETLVMDDNSEYLSPGCLTVEKDVTLHGKLNRSSDPDERYGLVRIKPDTAFDLNWDMEYADFELGFTESLEYGESYELSIQDQVYTLFCRGEKSIPIAVEAVYFCAEDNNSAPQELKLNQALGAYDSDLAYLEIVLSHSPSGEINQTSFMKALSIDSSVLNFNFLSMELESIADSGRSLIRVNMEVADTGFPGTVRLSLEDSLSDNLDNSLDTNWSMTVNQP